MADFSKLNGYNVKDATARQDILTINNSLSDIDDTLSDVDKEFDSINSKVSDREFINEVKYIAHRGCDNLAPENTIPAFEYVAKVGSYWGCETDVQRTSDGVFIIMHDDDVDRMTDGTGRVDELTYSYIQTIHIDSGSFIEEYQDLTVPTLTDYLKLMKKYCIHPVLEIKPNWSLEILKDLVDEVENCGLLYTTVFICYYRPVCENLRKINREITIQLLTNNLTEEQKTFCVTNKIDISVNSNTLTVNQVDELHSLGLRVAEFINYGSHQGVDYLTTADITRPADKRYKYQNIEISKWELDQIQQYGSNFSGILTTFIRRGISTGELGFPKYFQSTNNQTLVCYNIIPCYQDTYLNYNVPVGYDMAIHSFKNPSTGGPWASGWITGTGEDALSGNATYLRHGYIVLMFRRTDLENVTYRDIEILRNSVQIWLTKR